MPAQYGIIAPVPITSTQPVMRSITPNALAAGSTHNYAPVDLATSQPFYEAQIIRQATNVAGSTLTGLDSTHVPNGLYQIIENLGPTGSLTIPNELGSVPENRFSLPAASFALAVGGSAMFVYDGTTKRWRFVDQGGASSSAGAGGVIVNYVATGAEGTSFIVPIGQVLPTANYTITPATEGVANVPFFDFPQAAGDRTTSTFRCNTVAALTAGDKLVFVLFLE